MRKNPWLSKRRLFHAVPVQAVSRPKPKLKFGKIIWIALKKTCTVIGAVVLFSAVLTMCTISPALQEQQFHVPSRAVLVVDLDGKLGDLPVEESFVDAFNDNQKTLKSFIDAIYVAKDDPRIQGIYAKYSGGSYTLTQIQEIRRAIKDFKESGKFTYVYATSYNGGLGAYYLVSAFDEIWMQPMGTLSIPGLNAEMPFFRDALDYIGVKPQFFQRKEYKSAYESFSNSEISDANREAVTALINDITDVVSSDIAGDLSIEDTKFRSYVDKALFLGHDALDAGLIDFLDYEHTLQNRIQERVGGQFSSSYDGYLSFDDYHKYVAGHHKTTHKKSAPKVALVYLSGAIVDSVEEVRASFGRNGFADAEKISNTLLDIADDKTISAVVLRVDSPGGSPVASEAILNAVQKVRDSGKPVIVSMGTAAASGGYWVSAYADYIFASPLTVTGSIGVLGGKISLQEMWKKIGVNWKRLQWGENAGIWSMNTPFSESEAERVNMMLDYIYDSFLLRVSKGRNIPIDDVEDIARGRVWSGHSALKIGLVDALGGLNESLDYVAIQVGQGDRYDIAVQILPKPLNPVEKFVQMLEGQVRVGEIVGLQADIISYLRPVLQNLYVLEHSEAGSVYSPVSVQ